MPYKKYFNLPEDICYLNAPGNGPIPKEVLKWRTQWDQDFFSPYSNLRDQQVPFIQSVKETISTTFHSEVNNSYCVPNFSFGFSTLIDLIPSDYRFLLLEEEYPSLYYPIVNRRRQQITVQVSSHIEADILDAVTKHKPDVLLLSVVQYITGLKIDLSFIKQLKKDFPDLLIIGDATQYLGTEPFDFLASGFDAIGASGYKWLLSGFGNGLFMISDQLKKICAENLSAIPYAKEAMWSHKEILHTFFEPGHQDTLAHGTLQQSLLFLQQIGFSNVEEKIQTLKDFIYPELVKRKLLLPEIADREVLSSLINIQIDPKHYPYLVDQGVKCFPRGTGIRIGFHFYNDVQDLEKLLNLIDKIE